MIRPATLPNSAGLLWLTVAAGFSPGQVPPRAVLTGASVRVEVTVNGGKLQERFLAKQGPAWVELSVSNGSTSGALTVTDSTGTRKTSTVEELSTNQNSVIEVLNAGDLKVRRTISLTPYEKWLKATTHIDAGLPATFHSFADQMRATIPAEWSYSPSVGGFNPDAKYKSPLIMVQSGARAIGIVPDLAVLTRDVLKRCNHVLDLDARGDAQGKPLLSVGFIPARPAYHSVFREDVDRMWKADGPVDNSYYIYLSATAVPGEGFRDAVRFHWNESGRKEMAIAAAEQAGTAPQYAQCTLWDEWRRVVWDAESVKNWLSFPLPDGSTGGAVRMIRWGGPKPSVYLGAWFNSLRTAYGMALYAQRTRRADLMNLAGQTVQMALKAPGTDGAFKCIAVPGENGTVKWAAGDGGGASVESGFLGFDMSWTGYWLLKWNEAHLPGGAGILDRCSRLAEFLIKRQRADGMLPTRFDEHGDARQEQSEMVKGETAPVTLFLLELYRATRDPRYLRAAQQGLAFLEAQVIPERRWYDFETFWSCSPRLINFDERTRQWPANNLALIHATASYLTAYEATGEHRFLEQGRALLDYLLLYQQSWTNPALEELSGSAMLLGGFTTQNSDAEWSDARQSLAGNVLLDYYRATGEAEYLERGIAALRSQFPVSPSENWAHPGYGKKAGVSSFHWGSGSGMAGIEIEEDYLKDGIIDVTAKRGAGVNGLNVTGVQIEANRIRFHLDTPFNWNRDPLMVFRNAKHGQDYEVVVNEQAVGSYSGEALQKGLVIARASLIGFRPGRQPVR